MKMRTKTIIVDVMRIGNTDNYEVSYPDGSTHVFSEEYLDSRFENVTETHICSILNDKCHICVIGECINRDVKYIKSKTQGGIS